jgi:FtsP/CotA-like multicopper oxidase with cupredoxin domain
VALNPAEVAAALTDPAGVFPTPVSNPGPNWIQIGTEGGFLPAPVEIPPQPITWVTDPTLFNAGNEDQHSLLLGPAERADVVVDLSAYAGKTLILYNDAPAAFPARDPRYDYYTGNPDLTDTGGTPSTPRGYGPNTRTVMQIKVADVAPAAPFDLAALQAKFAHHTVPDPVDPVNNPPVPAGVFESSQPPIIVGQGAYNSAYGTTFQNNGPNAGLVQIFDTQFSFKTLDGGAAGPSATVLLGPKMIQDEMGEAFEPKYGRMSGNLGVETPNATAGNQNMILYAYPHPPTEVIKGLPLGVTAAQIGSADDNTQIWKITHNGVDTHPIHFHLYDVQLVNRVGWDGIIRKPDANELGWKDTVRISPLEDTIVALRPRLPTLPFELPNSVRLLDPSMPAGANLSNGPTFAPNGQPVTITNHAINFGAEYVWHCHILSHEEMDMMRPQAIAVAPKGPTAPAVTVGGVVSWTDNSISETGFLVQRANDATFSTGLVEFTAPANNGPVGGTISYTDSTAVNGSSYFYRVKAINLVGDTQSYGGNFFPTMTSASDFTEAVTTTIDKPALPGLTGVIATRLNAKATLPVRVRLNWSYTWPAGAGTANFVIERSADGVTFAQVGTAAKAARNWTDNSLVPGATDVTYTYRIRAVTTTNLTSAWSSATAVIPAAQVAPNNLAGTGFRVGTTNNARITLTWTDVAGETAYSVQRADDAAFTVGVVTTNNIAANSQTWTSGNLARNRTYYYRIRANNTIVGNSAWSAGIAVTTPLN